MGVISLSLAHVLPLLSDVDHTTMHGKCLGKDSICKIR